MKNHMENQKAVLMKAENNSYSGDKNDNIELDYRKGDQMLNLKVFFAKAWHDIKKNGGYILLQFKKKSNINLNRTCLFYANGAIHLTKIVDRKTPGICGLHHEHFVDVITGCEYCGHIFHECRKVINYDTYDARVFGSPIKYMTSEEFVKMNDYGTSKQEKSAIIYSMLKRANEDFQEQANELIKKR